MSFIVIAPSLPLPAISSRSMVVILCSTTYSLARLVSRIVLGAGFFLGGGGGVSGSGLTREVVTLWTVETLATGTF